MERRKTIENAVLGSVGGLLLVSGILSILLRPEAFIAFFGSDIILLGLGLLWIALFRDASFLPFDEERKKRFAYLWGGFLLALGFLGFLFLERYANASMGELVPPGESSLETNSLYVVFGSFCCAAYLVFGLLKNHRFLEEGKINRRRILREGPFLLLLFLGFLAFLLAQDAFSLFHICVSYLWIPLAVLFLSCFTRLLFYRALPVRMTADALILLSFVSFAVFALLLSCLP